MKLYEVPPRSKVRILGDNKNPVASKETNEGDVVTFYSIDGMYSFCKDENGNTVHLVAWTEVEVLS